MVNKPLTRPAASGGLYFRFTELDIYHFPGSSIYSISPKQFLPPCLEWVFQACFNLIQGKKQLKNIQTVLKDSFVCPNGCSIRQKVIYTSQKTLKVTKS